MSEFHIWNKGEFHITTDKSKLDLEAIHQYLTNSSWAKEINLQTVVDSIRHSLCFGLFYRNEQIGFARIITDYSTFGYLCDVFIVDEWQNKKLGSWLMKCCHSHPSITRLRRLVLVTSTAGWLYEKHEYNPVNQPNYIWQIFRPDIYEK